MQGMYARLRESRGHDVELQACVESVVNRLDGGQTSADRPGMLLGKIQSGKTRGFLGVIARAFDRGFGIALVFTKGTKTLATQTVKRIQGDFAEFIEDEDVYVFDIMAMPERLTQSERNRKLIIVAKKEVNNLKRLIALFDSSYPELRARRVLFVDDEADMASIRFVRQGKDEGIDQGTIAQQLDALRALIPNAAYLQVTATPYALYLQPENYEPTRPDQFVFLPKRPAFTELLPIHGGYVGGDDYFGSFEANDPRNYLFVPVPDAEQNALRSGDGRAIRSDRIWSSANIRVLRLALMGFLTSVVVRRWQQRSQDQRPKKYAMIIHNDTQRAAHTWQWETVERLREAFEESAKGDRQQLRELFNESYANVRDSVLANGGAIASADDVFETVVQLIEEGELNVQRVNSDVHVAPLLDPVTAELKLRTQANVFIGGSLLDRGITIPYLIAFYYGRNPKRMQADTVLQHSRMYGNRDRQDLAVTRFYTSQAVYSRLRQIHAMECALREAFESGGHDAGVVFIENDAKRGLVPCAPNKILMSSVVTVKPSSFFLPTDIDTVGGKTGLAVYEDVHREFSAIASAGRGLHRITLEKALWAIQRTRDAIVLPSDDDFSWEAMSALLTYYCRVAKRDEVELLIETGRELTKEGSGDKSGKSIVGGISIRQHLANTRSVPALALLGQVGKGKGWAGDMPFWWPVLVAPTNVEPCVFAKD